MDIVQPGFLLEELCRNAQQELVIAAPFVKANTLIRLLASIAPDLPVKCITRWRVEEIVSGVSDIEVWHIIRSRKNASLWLRADLHAKYYRGDKKCLVGSANITNAALGWSKQSNLELLVSYSYEAQGLCEFEEYLLAGCVQVDDSLFDHVLQMIQFVEQQPTTKSTTQEEVIHILDRDELDKGSIPPEKWLPTLRSPDFLYKAYKGELEKLNSAQKEAALVDLASLPLPADLSTDAFISSVGVLLLQKPIILKVDGFVANPQRFGAVRDFLASLPCSNNPNFDANDAWQTLIRWMLFFLPTRYRLSVPSHSEIFYRTK